MRILLFCSFLLLSCFPLSAQSDAFTSYDATTGRASAALYNGPIYINPFRPDQNSHHYLNEDVFKNAKLVYENQTYSVDELKYDIHQNKLVLQSIGDYNNIAIDLILDKISEFTLQGMHFIKLRSIDDTFPENQFYEQIVVNPASTIYVKHYKARKEIFKGDLISDRFSVRNDYYLATNGTITLINSKRDAIAAFPSIKKSINDFASANNALSKTNRSEFMTNLLRFISSQNK